MTRPLSNLALSSLAVAVLLLASPLAQAQDEAHCSWLKIKASGKGYELGDPNTPPVALGKSRSVKASCYAQLVYVEPTEDFPDGGYTAPLVCLLGANDVWGMTDADEGLAIQLLPDGNGATSDDYLTFRDKSGDVIQGYSSHVLQIKLDKEGAFRRAIWKTVGAEMIDGSTYFRTPARVLGGYVAKGVTVPAEKVPEGAREEVSGGVCP